ncbi:TniB family NTP-binding protein [Leifsonia shinshuensis]|uniref:AAA family ATPase n=1 Tax=Leifsonia shinshuensis TaxID=150026 RepID=A0A853CWW2_9MICO|nr:TniB family NTP-binding protein [Leifsonia shinshuensis]NYJ25596.1 hypothetical protein [Leifsonia shinshuensis]
MNTDQQHTADENDLNNHLGLTAFLRNKTPAPRALTIDGYTRLSKADCAKYKEERIDYLSTDITVITPQLERIAMSTLSTMRTNRGKKWGRQGVLVSGESNMGKTTAILNTARIVFQDYTRNHSEWEANGDIPVAFVNVPEGTTVKAMLGRFCEFFGYTPRKSDTVEMMKRFVVPQLNGRRTVLVIVDEIHNLEGGNRDSAKTVDFLKDLSNSIHATFIYAGIDIHQGAIFSGTSRDRQVRGRFRQQLIDNYGYTTSEHKVVWRGIVQAFGSELRLLAQSPQELTGFSDYLYNRTRGGIGPLNQLLRESAQYAIATAKRPENEELTLALMDKIDLDMSTEEATGGWRSTDSAHAA